MSEDLNKLRSDAARYRKLSASFGSLQSERDALAAEVDELSWFREKEQRDVDRLERVSLSSIVASIAGNMDERLDREKMEAHAAALKHDAAARRLRELEREIDGMRHEIDSLSGAEERFRQALDTKLKEQKNSDGAGSERILLLEERIADLGSQQRELREAMDAGLAAVDQTELIEKSLSSAAGWGIFDMLGGGLISTMVKHSHLDEAQRQVEHLQYLLSRFSTELADVKIDTNVWIQIDGFLRFADYFFDGLLADFAAQSRIRDSQAQIEHTKSQLFEVMDRLEYMERGIETELSTLRSELADLVSG